MNISLKKFIEKQMLPQKPLYEGENLDEDNLFEDLLTEDELFEDGWAEHVKKAFELDELANRLNYSYAWSHDDAGEPTNIFKYDKIHTREYHWIFPVHEVLCPDDLTKPENYGIVNRDGNPMIVILDAGMNMENWEGYYRG